MGIFNNKIIIGGDSNVRFENGQIIKRYHNLSIDHISMYAEITNSFANYIWDFENFNIKVNPIKHLKMVDNKVEAISMAIRGTALNMLPDQLKKARLGYYMTNVLSPQLNILARCSGINVVSWNVMCTNDPTAVITDICSDVSQLSRK